MVILYVKLIAIGKKTIIIPILLKKDVLKLILTDPTTFVIKRVLALENDIVQNRKK